ncbi:MAG: hypothetical protein Q7T46_12575, partial [Polaromonas sp.]|nr:hypothetical protein [Polaromonas sp.]
PHALHRVGNDSYHEGMQEKKTSDSVLNRCAIHHGGILFDKGGEALVEQACTLKAGKPAYEMAHPDNPWQHGTNYTS